MANKNNKSALSAKLLVDLILTRIAKDPSSPSNDHFLAALLQRKEVEGFLPEVLTILKKYKRRDEKFKILKIESNTEISDETLEALIGKMMIDKSDISAIESVKSENITAGLRANYKDISLDATLDTMIKKALHTIN